ncbi:MAG: hypothetical protein F4047_08825 [Caldilineaceae bacterium SB0670_bin_27]|uniref:Uncharacterized protein n=1 Tax=Caldilineaceae bacterium SB0664_bin_27 TaxID=2605260 RepID=A0A6B0YSP6_9CHLR|nr:hypothetical protein [Caldilineaceae bacterium SB0664_bin_27]MYJ78233.1 hypothetical protein [Caldilineaceae bacterium SB0670_bin_27]
MEVDRKEENRENKVGGEAESSDRSDDLTEEIHKLVEAMARAARNVWSSEQRLQLEEDLRRGLGSLVGNLEDALDRFSRSEQGQEIQEQANRVADRVRESELASELKEGLTVGLRSAADEVRKFADSFEEQQEKQEQAGTAQDIPVDSENDERREEST